MCSPAIPGVGGNGRSMTSIQNQMQTQDSKDATNQLAIFRDEQRRSDYRTAGEAGKAREADLTRRQRAGNRPLQDLLGLSPPPPVAGGLQVPV